MVWAYRKNWAIWMAKTTNSQDTKWKMQKRVTRHLKRNGI
jgi:hypothetical protein